jgi:hypothetical protein
MYQIWSQSSDQAAKLNSQPSTYNFDPLCLFKSSLGSYYIFTIFLIGLKQCFSEQLFGNSANLHPAPPLLGLEFLVVGLKHCKQ